MQTDTRIAAIVIALYATLCLLLLPAAEYPRALGGGALVFAVIAAIARHLGRGPIPGLSIIVVAFSAGLVLAFPTFPAMGGTTRAAVPLGFLGVEAAVLLWAALRWTPRTPEVTRTPLRVTWKVGLAAGAVLSAIAAIPAAVIALSGGRKEQHILMVFPAYFAGTLSAATAYWLLQRIAHLATGRYLIGTLGGICVYGAVAPVVLLARGEPLDLKMMAIVAAIAGSTVGPAVTLSMTDDAEDDTE